VTTSCGGSIRSANAARVAVIVAVDVSRKRRPAVCRPIRRKLAEVADRLRFVRHRRARL
jgi:hypothetical protein